jgi:multiple sugar transport system substrate-binding protein
MFAVFPHPWLWHAAVNNGRKGRTSGRSFEMDERASLSRRKLLQLTATGAIAAADLAWWDEPLIAPRKAWGAEPVRFQWSVPEPTRIALMNSLVERFNQSQKDFAVAIEYVPQAQARQKLISAITGGSPPDLCQAWDNWIGQFNGMGAVEDISARAKAWKHYADVAPTAWQTVTINDKIISLPLAVTLDGIYYRTDRLKELGLKAPTPDWTWDEFLTLAKAFTKADKNQYGFGMRGSGTWALLYPSEYCYANGAEVLKDGKVVINSKEAIDALEWYLDLALKHKVTPPSAATDGFVEIVETFGRGVTSMYQHNSGSSGQQKKNVGADNFATVPLPIGPAKKRASFWFSETLTMFKGAKQKEGAWQFMSFMLEDEPSLRYNTTLGLLPARKSILDKPEFANDPALAGFVQSFGIGIVSPYLAYPGWGGRIDSDGVPLIQQAMLGKISAKECLDRFAEILKKEMS